MYEGEESNGRGRTRDEMKRRKLDGIKRRQAGSTVRTRRGEVRVRERVEVEGKVPRTKRDEVSRGGGEENCKDRTDD